MSDRTIFWIHEGWKNRKLDPNRQVLLDQQTPPCAQVGREHHYFGTSIGSKKRFCSFRSKYTSCFVNCVLIKKVNASNFANKQDDVSNGYRRIVEYHCDFEWWHWRFVFILCDIRRRFSLSRLLVVMPTKMLWQPIKFLSSTTVRNNKER